MPESPTFSKSSVLPHPTMGLMPYNPNFNRFQPQSLVEPPPPAPAPVQPVMQTPPQPPPAPPQPVKQEVRKPEPKKPRPPPDPAIQDLKSSVFEMFHFPVKSYRKAL